MLDIFEAGAFGPVASMDAGHEYIENVNLKILVENGKQFGFCSSRHVDDFSWIENLDLVARSGIGLGICELAQNSFRSSEVDERESDRRRDASRLGDGTDDLVVPIAGRGRRCPRS